jgi:hypothetical protein
MKRFRDIIQDIKAPSTSDLWINNGGCFITIKKQSSGQYLVDYIEL